MFKDIYELISNIESDDNAYAIRFEPRIYERFAHSMKPGVQAPGDTIIINAILRAHNCSIVTACAIASISWGKFQIMGYRLYDPSICDLRLPIFEFVGDLKKQAAAFDLFRMHFGIMYTLDELRADNEKIVSFAREYNGAVVAYGDKIRKGLA